MIHFPFELGAIYERQSQIHPLIGGGQQQGGISTPKDAPFVAIFTGVTGKRHGYADYWDEKELFHYFGEGQHGDMKMAGGNAAIRDHKSQNKRLLLFQNLGKGKPCRFRGEFEYVTFRYVPDIPDTDGNLRTAIVFTLRPLSEEATADEFTIPTLITGESVSQTERQVLQKIRTKQSLFKRRLLFVEKECRITKISDLRFLRASHIKPWSKCESGVERTDGSNGLLLCPQADFLFDNGWISFSDSGLLLRSKSLPNQIVEKLGLDLTPRRKCGQFTAAQSAYMEFHRDTVFEKFS